MDDAVSIYRIERVDEWVVELRKWLSEERISAFYFAQLPHPLNNLSMLSRARARGYIRPIRVIAGGMKLWEVVK